MPAPLSSSASASGSDCDHPPPCPEECTHCLAYDRHTRSLCSQMPASPGSKWCAVHEELQAKALKSYKRHTLAVQSFDEDQLPGSFRAVELEPRLSRLREWSTAARAKWGLVERVVTHRREHHQQFYAGGDWGHCLFVELMKEESARLIQLMRLLDKTAYAITLAESQAEWILSAPSIGFICDEPPATAITTAAPPTPPPTPPLATHELAAAPTAPLTKSQRKARARKAKKQLLARAESDDDPCCFTPECSHLTAADQLARMRAYLIPPPSLPASIRPGTWHAFVSGLFRHVVLRSAALAPLALATATLDGGTAAPESVEGFLDVLEARAEERGGDEVGRLWRGMKFARSADESAEEGFLGVGVLAECLADVFRTAEEQEGQHVRLLGGKVFKEASPADLPAEGWDLFYQFVSCAGCSYSVTRSFASWTRNRRLAALGSYPAWLSPTESGPEHILRLARVLLCSTNSATCGRKVKRVEHAKPAPPANGKKPKRGPAPKAVLVEEWERAWCFLRMPVGDVWARAGLDLIASLPERFTVLARNAETGEVVHSPKPPPRSASGCRPSCTCCAAESVWLSRVRSGLTPLERRTAPWTTSTFFPLDAVLDSFAKNSSPERRFGRTFNDALDVLVVDNRPYSDGGEWDDFLGSVGEAFVRARGFGDPQSLLQEERRVALERGELALPGVRKGVWVAGDGTEGTVYSKVEGGVDPRVMFRELL